MSQAGLISYNAEKSTYNTGQSLSVARCRRQSPCAITTAFLGEVLPEESLDRDDRDVINWPTGIVVRCMDRGSKHSGMTES